MTEGSTTAEHARTVHASPPDRHPLTLGIRGAGQRGRMTARAAVRMGLRVKLLTPKASGSEAAFAGVTVADWEDPAGLRTWAEGCDAGTVESEWAPADRLAEAVPG